MPSYRLYRLDGAGKITTAEWVEAEHDDEALEQARIRCRVGAYEVWERNRLIVRMNGKSEPQKVPPKQ